VADRHRHQTGIPVPGAGRPGRHFHGSPYAQWRANAGLRTEYLLR